MECVRLTETLRGLRARTGLSLAALAAKTPYSKSSWERYLNGRTVPPRQAVEELCVLAGAEPGRPLALWELADAAWSGRAGDRPPPEASPSPSRADPPPPPDGGRFARRLRPGPLAGVLSGLAVGTVSVLLVTSGTFGADDGPRAHGTTSASAPASLSKGCHGGGCTGKDPEEYGCGVDPVPTTLSQQRFPGGTVVKIRRGAPCGTVWARIDLGNVGDRVEILAPRHSTQEAEVRDKYDAKGSLSTPMTAVARRDLDHVQACLVRDGKRHCFGTGTASDQAWSEAAAVAEGVGRRQPTSDASRR